MKKNYDRMAVRTLLGTLMTLYAVTGHTVQPVTKYEYDANGNRTKLTDPLNRITSQTYDALNRMKQVTDPATGITQFTYDSLNRLTGVTDPRNLTTNYTYNAFGDLLSLASPDTGTTQNTYDLSGNLLTRTDAKGQLTTYTYDALNRVTNIQYADGQATAYTYDQGTNGQGRLTGIAHTYPAGHAFAGNLVMQYTYDARGRVLTESRTLPNGSAAIVAYAYDSAGRLGSITYPSGRTVTYQYDTNGRVASVVTAEANGPSQTIATGMTYRPFGPAQSHVWGNNATYTKTFDSEGRLASYPLGASNIQLGYDLASNITSRTDANNSALNNTYTYDNLDRLTQQVESSTTRNWTYDAVGNRATQSIGANSTTYQYSATNNRLIQAGAQAVTSDANGAITNDGNNTFTYDARGRLVSSTTAAGTTSYLIDPLGRRLAKTGPLGTTQFVYDTAGHLVAELTAAGNAVQEHLWANETPISVATAQTLNGTEVLLDNIPSSFSTTGTWSPSTAVAGFQGANYQTHAASDGPVGTVVDNTDGGFSTTGSWTASTAVSGYQGANYLNRPAGGDPVDTVVLDNIHAGSSAIGTWGASTAVGGYQGTNYQTHAAGTGTDSFTWSTALTPGEYKVYAKWTANVNRASDAKYTVTHQSGQATVTVDQKQNGATWNLIGTYTFDATGNVSLSDQANGYVIADAVKFVPTSGNPPAATWNASLTPGQYKVYAKWTAHANRATDAKYTVTHASGTETVTVNQQQNTGWNLLGTYSFDTAGSVKLTDEANGYVIADAVRFVNTTAQVDMATWTPSQSGTYQVFAKWTANVNRASNAKYIVTHQAGQTTVTMDQKQNGGTWNSLGSFSLNPNLGHKIQLSSEADGYVIADAIRLMPTVTESQVHYVQADQLGTPRAVIDNQNQTVWNWDGDAFGNSPANNDPDQNGAALAYNLRFPGQYYDQETNTHYNYFRDYNPATGRYIESDPIGLAGGINTFAYVNGNPIKHSDPLGLDWVYSQSTGNLWHTNSSVSITGYAGYRSGYNNPSFENVVGMGPLPKGSYRIGAPYNSAHTGPYTLPLTQINGNSYGRDAFRIHGDNGRGDLSASNGCIIVPRKIREKIHSSDDPILRVIE
jgi:RHS repeat-associated protein